VSPSRDSCRKIASAKQVFFAPIYAFGGFVEQNRIVVPDCYAYVVAEDRWHAIHPLSRGSRGAISVVAGNGQIHAIGGRDTRSVDWH
jgi:N-acetylneuraminic acid mutarotase